MPRFSELTVSEAFDAFGTGAVNASWLDDKLWLSVSEIMFPVKELARLPVSVAHYAASRLIQWDVENGGFGQAAYNYREYFGPAAAGYRALGLEAPAALIEEAVAILADMPADAFDADEIGDLFEQFAESALSPLDDRLEAVGWSADEIRLAFAVEHRAAFEAALAGK